MTNEFEQRFKEIAIEIAPDYPGIKTAEPWEQLYAIKSSYEGVSLACDDLHKLIEKMRLMLNISKEEVCDMGREILLGGKCKNTLS